MTKPQSASNAGRPKNPPFPMALTKFSIALDSKRYKGNEASIKYKIIELASEISKEYNMSVKNVDRILRNKENDELNSTMSPDIIDFFKRKYQFTDEIRLTTDIEYARRLINAYPDEDTPKTIDLDYIRAKSEYKRFYEPKEDGKYIVDIVYDGATDKNTDTTNLVGRNRDPGCYLLHHGREYTLEVSLWSDDGQFYMLNIEPNGDLYCLCPSIWGRRKSGEASLVLPDDGRPAGVSHLRGIREIYGIICLTELFLPGLPLNQEPAPLTPAQTQELLQQLQDLPPELWSIRRFDYLTE